MSIREGLGYSLRYYDPCFNYNADRFCCSNRGAHFRENILLSDCPLNKNVNLPRGYQTVDKRTLTVKQSGIYDPVPYTATPQARQYTWCDRIPCGLEQHGIPCQRNQPYCTQTSGCGKSGACGNKGCSCNK